MTDVMLTLTGDATASVTTDSLGNYEFSSLEAGGSYTVTPTKSSLAAGAPGITTEDIIAIQQHILQIAPLSRCRLEAADVNGDHGVNTIDRIAIERFYLGMTSGISNVGKYKFTPANRSYNSVLTDQTDQNYDSLIFGDVAAPFAESPGAPGSPADNTTMTVPAPAVEAAILLPNATANLSDPSFTLPVTVTTIDARDDLIGFQGDVIFDSSLVGFQDPPVQNAGLTTRDWNVSANVLPGTGNLRTLRISAFSKYFSPLRGPGTLFELRMTRVRRTPDAVPKLVWASPPNNFIFIDFKLKEWVPRNTAPGPARTPKAKPVPPSKSKPARPPRN